MKWNKKAFAVKLWRYFMLFAAVILALLWLMQTVFLQSFYESMKKRDLESTADKLVQSYDKEDFEQILNHTAFADSMLIYITDTEGGLLFSADDHGPVDQGTPPGKNGGNQNKGQRRALPMDYDDFLEKLFASESGSISYIEKHDSMRDIHGRTLVCGRRVPDGALYLSTPLKAVNTTTSILRTQLFYAMIVALLLSLVVSYFIARRFSKPIGVINRQAKEMATGAHPEVFEHGFCSELDELADTLTLTSVELSKVEKLRRELIANISHDLRTPLTMIKAYAEMIRDISGDNPIKRNAHLAVIVDEADRLTDLVRDLLDLSAIQSGTAGIEKNNVNLSEVTRRVIERFEPILLQEDIVLTAEIEPDQYALCDENRMMQVMINLLSNAMHHVGEDKQLTLRLQDEGGSVRFEICDKGEGIPQEELQLIWERYYQSKKNTNHQGTGLGLSIVKGILEMHHAKYGVNSQRGSGSVFWFEMDK